MIKLDKAALVLGACSSVGVAVCDKLSQLGYNVHKQGSKQRDLDKYYRADLSVESGVNDLFEKIPNKIDVFVSCLGGNRGLDNTRNFDDNCSTISSKDINWIFRLNLFANMQCAQKVLSKNCTKIVFIGSDVVGHPRPGGEVAIYALAKAALHEYTLHLSNELKDKNISVNCISPSGINASKLIYISTIIETICSNKYNTGNVIRVTDGGICVK